MIDDDDDCILNRVTVGNVPITCTWSKYGETLVFGTSDNFVYVWNIAACSMDTYDVTGTVLTCKFISDMLLVVVTGNGVVMINIDDGGMQVVDNSASRKSCQIVDNVKSDGEKITRLFIN